MAANATVGSRIGGLLFMSRWMQVPLYLGLVVAQVVYVVRFLVGLWEYVEEFSELSEAAMLLLLLSMIDAVLVANLLIMIVVGGYETFVSRIRLEDHPDRPAWLAHVNPYLLKVKLLMAILGIASVNLLAMLISIGEADGPTGGDVGQAVAIQLALVVTTLALAMLERLRGGGSRNGEPAEVG